MILWKLGKGLTGANFAHVKKPQNHERNRQERVKRGIKFRSQQRCVHSLWWHRIFWRWDRWLYDDGNDLRSPESLKSICTLPRSFSIIWSVFWMNFNECIEDWLMKGRLDGRKKPLIEMLGRILKEKKFGSTLYVYMFMIFATVNKNKVLHSMSTCSWHLLTSRTIWFYTLCLHVHDICYCQEECGSTLCLHVHDICYFQTGRLVTCGANGDRVPHPWKDADEFLFQVKKIKCIARLNREFYWFSQTNFGLLLVEIYHQTQNYPESDMKNLTFF